jgi:predicted  nucleic acid-binding Zn-ribbon protein
MKPIRSNELLYLDKVINDKFYAKRKDVETEISQTAQAISDKADKHFPKELKVDSKLKTLNQAYKQYADFIQTKERMENDLRTKVKNLAEQVEEHLDKYKQSRNWDVRFDGYDLRDDGTQLISLNVKCVTRVSRKLKSKQLKITNFIAY